MPVLSAGQTLQLLHNAGVPNANLGEWLARARAESSLQTDVVNSIGAVGLLQINQPVHVKDHPEWTVAWLKDPANNVAAARILSNNWTNTQPWAASRLGTIAYLPASQLQADFWLQSTPNKVAGALLQGNPVGQAALPTIAGAVDTAQNALHPLKTVDEFLGMLSQASTWKRVGYGVIGAGLLLMAVSTVARGSVLNSQTARAIIGTTKAVATKRPQGGTSGA